MLFLVDSSGKRIGTDRFTQIPQAITALSKHLASPADGEPSSDSGIFFLIPEERFTDDLQADGLLQIAEAVLTLEKGEGDTATMGISYPSDQEE
ncbi:hypothetical protein ACFL0L_02530 [Patescibacteria group bacterium]